MSMYVKYLVCYDISDNKRRKKFSDSLKDMGMVAMQESVFYGDLKPAEARALGRTAREQLDEKEDKCFWFPCRLNQDEIRECLGYANWVYTEPDGHGII